MASPRGRGSVARIDGAALPRRSRRLRIPCSTLVLDPGLRARAAWQRSCRFLLHVVGFHPLARLPLQEDVQGAVLQGAVRADLATPCNMPRPRGHHPRAGGATARRCRMDTICQPRHIDAVMDLGCSLVPEMERTRMEPVRRGILLRSVPVRGCTEAASGDLRLRTDISGNVRGLCHRRPCRRRESEGCRGLGHRAEHRAAASPPGVPRRHLRVPHLGKRTSFARSIVHRIGNPVRSLQRSPRGGELHGMGFRLLGPGMDDVLEPPRRSRGAFAGSGTDLGVRPSHMRVCPRQGMARQSAKPTLCGLPGRDQLRLLPCPRGGPLLGQCMGRSENRRLGATMPRVDTLVHRGFGAIVRAGRNPGAQGDHAASQSIDRSLADLALCGQPRACAPTSALRMHARRSWLCDRMALTDDGSRTRRGSGTGKRPRTAYAPSRGQLQPPWRHDPSLPGCLRMHRSDRGADSRRHGNRAPGPDEGRSSRAQPRTHDSAGLLRYHRQFQSVGRQEPVSSTYGVIRPRVASCPRWRPGESSDRGIHIRRARSTALVMRPCGNEA